MVYIEPTLSTVYVSRALDLPPLTAQAAFDAHRDATALEHRRGAWVLETPSTVLRLVETDVVSRRHPLGPLRQARGRLRSREGLVGIAVELELTPWSDTRCEIGIRPEGWMVPLTDGYRLRRYVAMAVQAAEGFSSVLADRVEAWMTREVRYGMVSGALVPAVPETLGRPENRSALPSVRSFPWPGPRHAPQTNRGTE